MVDSVRLTAVDVSFDIAESTYTAGFRMDDAGLPPGTLRRFVVAGHDSIPVLAQSSMRVDRVSTLKSDTTHADMIVIAHPALIESECSEGNNSCSYDAECVASPTDRCEIETGSSLDLLLSLRSSQGIDSRVARIQDVEDDFNNGLPGPLAIKSFLSWVYNGGWSGDPPAYVMLIGDGTYNYKDAGAAGNLVPTQIVIRASAFLGHFASDNTMTTVAGSDFTPDLLAGRISTRTLAETDGVLDKIREYETSSPAGDWHKSLLFISDRGKSLCEEADAAQFQFLNESSIDVPRRHAVRVHPFELLGRLLPPGLYRLRCGVDDQRHHGPDQRRPRGRGGHRPVRRSRQRDPLVGRRDLLHRRFERVLQSSRRRRTRGLHGRPGQRSQAPDAGRSQLPQRRVSQSGCEVVW